MSIITLIHAYSYLFHFILFLNIFMHFEPFPISLIFLELKYSRIFYQYFQYIHKIEIYTCLETAPIKHVQLCINLRSSFKELFITKIFI